jgi:hypothetical protein
MSYAEAEEHLKGLGYIQSDDGLYDGENYLSWNNKAGEAVLDGSFTAKDLMAIAVYMMEKQS